ncbi:MAG: DUF4139 domain-containing protein [Candidatus Zixiibacteriota bacterium]
MMPNATWSPSYDACLLDSNRVEISYFAQVVQRTGEDWNDVELTLSTAQPNRASTPGNLAARVLAAHAKARRNRHRQNCEMGSYSPDRSETDDCYRIQDRISVDHDTVRTLEAAS